MPFKDKLLAPLSFALKTDRLLSAAEASNLLGLKPGTMYDLVAKGQLDFVRLFGKTLRFRESVILKLIADSTVESTNFPTLRDTPKRKHQKTDSAIDFCQWLWKAHGALRVCPRVAFERLLWDEIRLIVDEGKIYRLFQEEVGDNLKPKRIHKAALRKKPYKSPYTSMGKEW